MLKIHAKGLFGFQDCMKCAKYETCVNLQEMYKIQYYIFKVATQRRPNIGFQDRLSLNAGQKYCRMHSAILSTFIKLPFVIKIFVLSIFEWTGFNV